MTDMKILADVVEEGLTSIGIFDDFNEILGDVHDDEGKEGVLKAVERYNVAIDFINEHMDESREPVQRITENKLNSYGLLD